MHRAPPKYMSSHQKSYLCLKTYYLGEVEVAITLHALNLLLYVCVCGVVLSFLILLFFLSFLNLN